MMAKDRRFLYAVLISCIIVFVNFSLVPAAEVGLSWDPPATNEDGSPLTDLSGYIIYYGNNSGNYTQSIDVGNITAYKVNNLTAGLTYFFAVTAYDTSGNESIYSNEVMTTIPPVNGIVIDNGDAATSSTGSWYVSDGPNPYGTNSLYADMAGATYSFEHLFYGEVKDIEIYQWWTYAVNRCTNAQMEIYDSTGLIDTLSVNQQANEGQWNYLGIYKFEDFAKVDIISGGLCTVSADAVQYIISNTYYQCSDGIDNDGDGLIDYPDDSGCSSLTDNDEHQPLAENNLIGYWNFDEANGTTAQDSSGYGNDGILVNGPTWTTEGGLSFDGTDDYVDAGNDSSVNITGNITVSAWIYMNSLPSASARDFTIVSKGTAQNYYKFRIDSGTDKAEMLLDTGTGVVCTDTTTNLQAGQWYHITGRYNGTEQQLFINGIPGTSCSDTGNIDQNASDILCIGNNECGIRNDKGFDGIIDDVRIYNRALSDNEIQQLYDNTVEPLICTSFTYSDWSPCQSDGTQTRTVTSSSPAGCTGGNPATTQSCTYMPPVNSDTIISIKTDQAITIDGLLSESAWNQSYSVEFNNLSISDNQIKVYSLYDNINLYFAYEVTDFNIESIDQALHQDDGAEIFIDTNNDKSPGMDSNDYHFLININDFSSDGDIRTKTAIYSNGYTMEISIPWTIINTLPAPGKILGLLLANNDRDNGIYSQFDWMNLINTGSYFRPNLWGNITLASQSSIPSTCTSFTYSEWSSCQANGTQTRTVISSSPEGCSGGNPVITQSCDSPLMGINLIGYWNFDEASGTTAFDSSGFGNDGALVNGPGWTAEGGLYFDGTDDYVDAGNDASVNITGNITVSAWIYMNSLPSASARDFTIVSKGTAQNYYKFRIDSGTDKAEMLLDTGTGVVCTDTTTNLNAGQWYHITGRYDGTEQQLFINGVAGTSCSDTGNIDQNAPDILCIGNNECGIRNDKGFDGIIDDVRIYNRALSDNEIQALYNLQ